LRNTENVSAHDVETVIYYPEGLRPDIRDNKQPEKVEYFMHPERVILRAKSPPKSNPIARHIYSVRPNKVNTYEFGYEVTGERVKKEKGKLFLEVMN